MFSIGATLVENGHMLASGNAHGSDAAWAAGGNSVDAKQVILYLPWPTYNNEYIIKGNKVAFRPFHEWFGPASQFHGGWDNLGQGGKKLMARNYGIVHKADAVLAYLNHNKRSGGGTGHGWRVAEHFKIPRFNVAKEPSEIAILNFIKQVEYEFHN